MALLKYVMAAILTLAALEATRQFLSLQPTAHLAIAGVLLVYGLATLLLLKPAIAKRADEILGGVDATPDRDGSRFALLAKAIFLLLFRVSFVLAALAYLAQALSLSEPGFLRSTGPLGYPSFLLTVFDATLPPLSALIQYFAPDLLAAALNHTNTWALVFRVIVYVTFAIMAVAVVKDIWSLGYNSRLEELRKVIEINRLMGAPATPPAPGRNLITDLEPRLQRELSYAEAEADRIGLPPADDANEWLIGMSKLAHDWSKRAVPASELFGMADSDLFDAKLRYSKSGRSFDDTRVFNPEYDKLEELIQRVRDAESALGGMIRLWEAEYALTPSYKTQRRYLELIERFARGLGVYLTPRRQD